MVIVSSLLVAVLRGGSKFNRRRRSLFSLSFASSFPFSSSRSSSSPLFQQKTTLSQDSQDSQDSQNKHVNAFSDSDNFPGKIKTQEEPINKAQDNSERPETETETDDQTPYTDAFTDAFTSTPPFPPTPTPAFTFPTPVNYLHNYPSQKRLRLRVYHLQNRWSTDPTTAAMDESRRTTTTTTIMAADSNDNTSPPRHEQPFSSSPRPPPLPLSTSTFAFERPGLGSGDTDAAMPSDDTDASIAFIHQPNPDYAAVDEESTSSASSASSAAERPATPTVDTAGVGVTGEILSLLDDTTGQGWTRHTRVYGGGVCLACLAAESSGDGGDGGEYGDSVPMEDRR